MATNDELMAFLELIAGCEPCERIPDVPGADTAQRDELMGRSFRTGWINISHYAGDGTFLNGESLSLTRAGRAALRAARDDQDAAVSDRGTISIEEKRNRRSQWLKELYDRAGGGTGGVFSSREIGESLGWDYPTTRPVVRYLAEKGFIAYRTLGGNVALTAQGVEEVERLMSPSSPGTDDLAGIHVSTGDVSGTFQVVQQGSASSTVGSAPPSDPPPVGWIKRIRGWVWIVILGALGSLLAVGIVALIHHDSSPGGGTSATTTSVSTSAPASRTSVIEYGDNHHGSPVYASPSGDAVASGTPNRIPFGTLMSVKCRAPNRSGIASVTAFYLIADGHWKNDYVVADTMTNGGPVGNTTAPNVDPRVPACP